jgi:hypothetical protein
MRARCLAVFLSVLVFCFVLAAVLAEGAWSWAKHIARECTVFSCFFFSSGSLLAEGAWTL